MAIIFVARMTENIPTPVFENPWHAQVFAITVALNEAGLFSWPEWAQRFGDTLKHHGRSRDLNGGSDYFDAWLETLEAILRDRQIAMPEELRMLKSAWTQAYLNTPHGSPVTLDQT